MFSEAELCISFLNFVFHLMFSLFVPWQQECEELCKNIDTLKDENSVLTQRLVALSEECLELTNENESIQVHHFNSSSYLFNFMSCIQLRYLFGLRKYFLFSIFTFNYKNVFLFSNIYEKQLNKLKVRR
jgi:hypothetical protein